MRWRHGGGHDPGFVWPHWQSTEVLLSYFRLSDQQMPALVLGVARVESIVGGGSLCFLSYSRLVSLFISLSCSFGPQEGRVHCICLVKRSKSPVSVSLANVYYKRVHHISECTTFYLSTNTIVSYTATTLGTNYNYIRSS